MRHPARPFRIAFVLVLMSLVLVRGWVGDAMAIGKMPALDGQSHSQVHAVQMPCHDAMEDPHHDSRHDTGAHETASASVSASAAASGDDCGTCTSCQVCHSSAVALLPGALPATRLPQSTPPRMTTQFASAEPQPGLKPPIS